MDRQYMSLETIELKNKKVYLLGTAHISEESVQDVVHTIETLTPDIVAIELDEARKKRLTHEDQQWQNMNMFSVIKQKKALFLLSSIVLSSFQRRLGESLSVAPGEEMLTALRESEKRNIPVVLADRSAEITLKRAWNTSSFWGRQKILATLISIVFSRETVTEEELKDLKQKSTQGQMMEEISNFLPGLKKVLLDERDEYLATNIINAEGNTVLAVLGAAHVPGIKKRIEDLIQAYEKPMQAEVQDEVEREQNHEETQEDAPTNQEISQEESSQQEHTHASQHPKMSVERLKELEVVPDRKKINFLGYIVPFCILGLFAYGFYRGGVTNLIENFSRWWIINGGLSMIGAIITLAHPATIILSFLAAPITSLNPFIGVGMLAGLSETFFRSPRVKDFEEIQTLSLSIKGLYKNRVTRILLVLFATSMGSIIGTFLGASMIATNV